ncbi:MAG: ChaB family protein [Candidatus Gastranaerophilales bacterium]|nr:ChaB family protein [Candidatus Gastranaerophilales bacterium]
MFYKFNKDLPPFIQNHLPEQAQDIFREAYNGTLEKHKDRKHHKREPLEEAAYKAAWTAVKEKYVQKNQKWVAIKQLN